jgi:hypothetical protein
MYGVKRPFPNRDEPLVSKHPRIQEGVIHVGVAAHARYGVMFGTFVAGTLHQPHLRVGIVARHHWSPWECIAASRGWTVMWMAEDYSKELTPSRISFDSLSLAYLIQSQVSLILSDGRLPGPSSFWWASTSPLLLVVGIILPKRKPDSTEYWHHQRIPWTHASCGGVSANTGTCDVETCDDGPSKHLTYRLASAIPLICFIHNYWGASFQGPNQGQMATYGCVCNTYHLA